MNLSTWNCRSLGTRKGPIELAKRSFYRNMVQHQDLVVLTETRHIRNKAWQVKWTKGMHTLLATPARGINQNLEEAIEAGALEIPHFTRAYSDRWRHSHRKERY